MSRSTRYPAELRERAVRMVSEIRAEHESEWAAMGRVAGLLGVGTDTPSGFMLPLRAPSATDADRWTVAASHNGLLGVTFAVRRDVRPLLDVFGHFYVSSANATGAESAVSARQAAAEFDEGTLVLCGDDDRDLTRPHGSATILGVVKDGILSVLRRGVHDLSFADSSAYVDHLVGRYG